MITFVTRASSSLTAAGWGFLLGSTILQAGASPLDSLDLTIAEIQSGLSARIYSAQDLTQAYLDRIALYEPTYNAFTNLNPAALADAREIDRRRAAGEALGPLAGIPIVIKDSIDVAGLPTTAGWARLSASAGGFDLVPPTDAPLVARLRKAGAIILGKTNLPAFSLGFDASNSWAGPTYNALDRGNTSGGSSSGTATAVAADFAVAGFGASNAGSLEVPAAAQSLVAVKPTFGLVPNTGAIALSSTGRNVLGPITRSVRDAAMLLDVVAGFSADDLKTTAGMGQLPPGGYTSRLGTLRLAGARVGLYGPGFEDTPLSPQTARLFSAAVVELEVLGATIVEDPFAGTGFNALAERDPAGIDSRPMQTLPYDFDQYLHRFGPDAPAQDLVGLRVLADPFAPGEPLNPLLPLLAQTIDDPTVAPELTAFAAARQRYLEIFRQVFVDQRIDVLVMPEFADAVPDLGSNRNPLLNDFPVTLPQSEINLAGVPAVVVPAGQYADGSPFSLVFIGPMWSEAKLLAYAYDYEQATHHRIFAQLELAAAAP